jgi:adenylate kinase
VRIVFIGPPGAGKGTQAERLNVKYHMAHLSTGELLRRACEARTPLGLRVQQYMSSGELVPDSIIIDVICERLEQADCRQGYLLDGIPRTIAQAHALDAMLAQRETPLDAVLELHVPDEELFERLAHRGRADDRPEVIRHRLDSYHQQTEPLLEHYRSKGLLRTIDGSGGLEEVFGRARAVLESFVSPSVEKSRGT